jgi:hypothetical protein
VILARQVRAGTQVRRGTYMDPQIASQIYPIQNIRQQIRAASGAAGAAGLTRYADLSDVHRSTARSAAVRWQAGRCAAAQYCRL